jgi:hypothetical protein
MQITRFLQGAFRVLPAYPIPLYCFEKVFEKLLILFHCFDRFLILFVHIIALGSQKYMLSCMMSEWSHRGEKGAEVLTLAGRFAADGERQTGKGEMNAQETVGISSPQVPPFLISSLSLSLSLLNI